MKKLLQAQFPLKPIEIKKLWGYDNSNYLVKTNDGQYVFKTYLKNTETFALVEAENETLLFLHKTNNKNFPKPIIFKDSSLVKIIKLDGKEMVCRMLSFLYGELLGSVTPTKTLYKSLGRFIAQMDLQLQSFNNSTIKARQWQWDIQYLHLNKKYIKDIPSAKDRSLIGYFFQQYEENVLPALSELRKSTIHGDANEWNVLVNNGKVTGIIDFSDLVYTPLINELAITIAYACLYIGNPLEWASTIIVSYHKVLALEEKEIAILYYLIAARLCVSVCNSAHSKKENPDNKYTLKSEKSVWKLLYQWLRINPIAAENRFRSAIGLTVLRPKSINRMKRERQKVIPNIFSLSYSKPVYMAKSAFQYMYDAYGNTYLDAYNNIPHVGHSHPKVVEAGRSQMAKLNTNTRYLYDLLPEYAEKLLSKFPDTLNKVYFLNSGSAASDLAIRLAQEHSGYKNLMVVEYGYHGHTQTGIDISDYKFNNKLGHGQKNHILKAVIPDTYRGKYTINDGSAGKMYAKDAIGQIRKSDSTIAAFISEPILGCAGQVPLARGYLKKIYPEIRKQGGVCISDEVQTGFGRLGEYFWGFEAHEVIPDIVIIGKPMGNGHPMGAVITTHEIAESFNKGVELFSS
ncbi:aminotransferase class III-fold pyridoxal phosphate-dependent enzyme, partial [Candidatus Neomarinimicrobiota bacterium]